MRRFDKELNKIRGEYFDAPNYLMMFDADGVLCEMLTQRDVTTKDFIKILERNGWRFKRSGGNHDIYSKGKECEAVPRHKELDELLVKAIIKRRNLK